MTTNSDITIITVVENDCGILDLMIRSVFKFTAPQTNPQIIICDQGSNSDLTAKYSNNPAISTVKNTPTMKGGSNRHSEGLNKIFPLVTTKKTAIIESDCVLLSSGWDTLDFTKYKMMAAKKGETTGQPYYHVCFMVFSTALFKHGGIIDFRPGKDGNRANRSYYPHEDVGWRVREKVRPDEVKLLDFIDCKTNKGQIFDSSFQSDELWLNRIPIIGHFGRGSNLNGKAIRKGFGCHVDQLKRWKEIAEGIIK